MSDYCCRPGNRCTTHSRSGSASGSPRRPAHWTETIAPLHESGDGYCGTPSRVATSKASAPKPSGIRNRETRNLPPRLSADSSPGSPPSEGLQTDPAVAPTPPAPLVPFAPAAPCHPRNELVSRTPDLAKAWRPVLPTINREGIPNPCDKVSRQTPLKET